MTAPTPATIFEDLALAFEVDGGEYGYALSDDSSHIIVEHYGDLGEIDGRYRLDLTINKEN